MKFYGQCKIKDDKVFCTKCKVYKCKIEFNESCLSRKYYICKSCEVEYRKSRKGNINRLIDNIYFHQVHKKNGMEYTWEQFSRWLIEQKEFLKLYALWIECDCDNQLTPTVSRIDAKTSFRFDNLKFTNAKEARNINIFKRSRPVVQMDLDGIEIAKYPNARIAANLLKISAYQNIHEVCKGQKKTCRGFKWKYL